MTFDHFKRVAVLSMLLAASAVAQVLTLSQSTNSTVVTNNNSAACGPAGLSFTVANGYFRSYPLSGLTGNTAEIVSISFGVQAVNTTQPAGFPMEIRLYNDPTPSAIAPYAGLVLRHTESFFLPPTLVPTVVTRVISGPPVTFQASETLVVEIFAPDGTYTTSRFIMGSNTLGQSAPGFLRSPACAGLSEPTDVASAAVGSPLMHMIIDVNYVLTQPVPYAGTGEDLVLLSAVGTSPFTGGFANQAKTVTAGNALTLEILSPAGGLNLREVALIAQPYLTGSPPFPPAAPGIHLTIGGLLFLIGGVSSPLGAPLLAPGGTSISFTIPVGLSGASVMFQGAVITWTAPFAANGLYASTDALQVNIL